MTPSDEGGTGAPLLVTATLDPVSHRWFDDLRREHFPPERNHLAAHVTLFHALPGARRAEVARAVAEVCASVGPVQAEVTGLRSLGGGVAYSLDCPPLTRVHARLQDAFAPWVTRQDARPFWAHVTVQNKVAPEAARALLARLEHGPAPPPVVVTGLALWFYRGGPWEPLSEVPFAGP